MNLARLRAHTVRVPKGLLSGLFACSMLTAAIPAFGQNRDFNAERLIMDDNGGDGTRNTMTLQVPQAPSGLSANRTLTFPDADGVVLTAVAPLTPQQILFGGPSGQAEQSASLLFNSGTGLFDIGIGNFTVDATTGNTTVGGSLDMTDGAIIDVSSITGLSTTGDLEINTSGTGDVTIGNGSGVINVDANVIPTADNTYSLGTDGNRFSDVFVNGGSVHIGDADGLANDSEMALEFMGVVGTINVVGGNPEIEINSDTPGIFLDPAGSGTPSVSVLPFGLRVNTDVGTNLTLDEDGIERNAATDQSFTFSNSGAGDLDVVVDGDLNATGNTDVDGTLNVDGSTTHVGTLDQQGAVSNSTGDVVVNDDANVTGSLDVDTDLNVDGTTTLVGAVDAQAAGNAIGDGTDAEQLQVNGVDGGAVEVDVNGDMDVSGTLTAGTLNLGLTPGSVTFADASGNITEDNTNLFWDDVNNRLGVGNNTPGEALDVTGNIVATGTIQSGASIIIDGTTPGSHNISTSGAEDLTIAPGGGDLRVSGNTNVTGSLDVDTDLNVDGNTVHVGTLDQQGAVSNSTGDVVLNDDANITGSLDVDTDLNVDGNTVHVGTLDQQGAVANSVGDVVLNDDANVTGSLDVDTDLNVDGNTVHVGTLDQQGAVANSVGDVVLNDDANVTGSLDVDTDLNVDGTTTLVGAVDAQAAGNTIGDGTDAEQLQVNGVDGGAVEVDVNGDMDVSGTLTAGTLNLGLTPGSVTFADASGNITEDNTNLFWDDVNNRLGVGNNTPAEALDVTGNIVATGTIQSGASIIIDGTTPGSHNISTSGAEDLTIAPGGGDLVVTGNTHVTGSLDVDTDLNVDGNAVHVGTLDQQGAVANSVGDVVLNDDANVTGSLDVDTDLNVDGNTVHVGTLDQQGAVSNSTGNVVVNDDLTIQGNVINIGLLDQQGAVSNSLGDVMFNDQVAVNSDGGANLLISETGFDRNSGVDETISFDNNGAGGLEVDINGDANITGSLDVDTDLNVDGNTVHVGTLDQQGAISNSAGDVVITDNLVPSADATYDLGSNTNRFNALYVAGPTIHIGSSADEAQISFTATGLELDGDDDGSSDLTIDGATGNVSIAGDLDIAGTLTVPATPAQGDALIASINTATTTINAVRIGSGLTDAQVNNDLTINGGTIDNTPIGGTTPSTGAFTTITGTALPAVSTATDIVTSNGGALETRTIASLAGTIGVSTNGTLTGDGTTGTPLGINLSNANTWTATQTLPVTAAQGDALIASTNAGTTTVDAARIGAGLTDAQVNDNLTINGGTVDASPIGATTPSTGAFTTITGTALPAVSTATDIVTSNGGALETRTIASLAGTIGVSTNGTLTGDGTTGTPLGINLSNANTWTATQTLPVTATQGDALIASTNAGTTTVDAARIGTGLTDAQVNDNLTINGGTVDASPIGATTPSTGAFTTITGTTLPAASTSADIVTSNGGALETRTIASLAGTIGVSTNGTLTGDGTTGTPLGIDLSNANTWTATQTLPVTAAQGDALIASTNAGTTTIDAARIGAGLTDAQVNDNLTINGGTVDASPIGATTPSTGAFTSLSATTITGTALPATSTSTEVVVSNGGALETRSFASLAGTLTVSTDGATLTGDGSGGNPLAIDLTNANTWTGTQTLPVSAAQGDALIASTNAGTGTVDATRIGSGLTNAQVNDDLTVDGGTIENTPIGGTTPAAASFTTINGSSSITLGDDATPTAGTVVLHDATATNTFTGTVATATALTNDRTYTLPDADGTIALQGDAISSSTITVNSGAGTDLTITESGVDRSGSGNDETFAIENTGGSGGTMSVLVNGATATTNSRLTVSEGHWTSQQATIPTIAATTGFSGGGTVAAVSTDVAGQFTGTEGTGTAGAALTITFNQAYASAPIVVITPANALAASTTYYVTSTTTSFTITVGTSGVGAHTYNYQVIEGN